MTNNKIRQRQAKTLRAFRKIHRTTGVLLFGYIFIIAVTGILLGWKKQSNGLIQPITYTGTNSDLMYWLPLDSLHKKACNILHDSISTELSLELERVEIRKDKGIVKFIFTDHFWGIQLDGATGRLLNIEQRRSDYIEKIHDGSILDYWLGTSKNQIKLVYTSLMGLALMMFTITGFWLWYGPKRMK